MSNEFRKYSKGSEIRYVLETSSGGVTGASNISSSPVTAGKTARRMEQEGKAVNTTPTTAPRNYVARNAAGRSGAGAHRDEKRAAKQGDTRHKKPFAEARTLGILGDIPYQKFPDSNGEHEPTPPLGNTNHVPTDSVYDRIDDLQRERLRKEVKFEFSNKTGESPISKEEYNQILTITSKTETQAESEVAKFKGFHRGAKEVVDVIGPKETKDGFVTYVYYFDRNKNGDDDYIGTTPAEHDRYDDETGPWNWERQEKDQGVAEGSEEKDPVWNKGTPMPKDYTCHCGLYVHPSRRNPKAIHASDCPYAKKQDKKQGVAEGAPELLNKEMLLVRHIEQELAQHGYEKGTPEYDQMFKHTMSMYRKFGNIDLINEQGAAEAGYGNHPSQQVDPRTGKKYVPPKSPLGQGVAEGSLNELSKNTLKSYSKKRGETIRADQRDADGAREMAADKRKHGDTKAAAGWDDEANWLDTRAERGSKGVARATIKIAKMGEGWGLGAADTVMGSHWGRTVEDHDEDNEDDEEYNDEEGMAQTNLHTLIRSATELMRSLKDHENLPEWVQEKLAILKANLRMVTDYMLSQHEQGRIHYTDEEEFGGGSLSPVHGDLDEDAYIQSLSRVLESTLTEVSKSKAQFNIMAASAHDPEFANRVGIPQKVAREFNKKDKGRNIKKLPRHVKPKKKK